MDLTTYFTAEDKKEATRVLIRLSNIMVAFEKLKVENYIKYFNNEDFRLYYVKYSPTADETKESAA